MRLQHYLTELANTSSNYPAATFIDLDETLLHTFAKINVYKHGKLVRSLDNQQFNTDKLGPEESYDFREFRSADLFFRTSIPIEKTVNRVQNMIDKIQSHNRDSRIIFLTARADFDDKKTFLATFEKYGIKMDKPTVYVERTGNMTTGTVAENKKKVILDYLKTGLYRRVRLIDDDIANLKVITDIEKTLPIEIEQKVRDRYNLSPTDKPIEFYALHVDSSGTLKRVN